MKVNIINEEMNGMLSSMNIGNAPEFWGKYWPLSQKTFSEDGMFFLQPNYIINSNKWLRLPEDAILSCIHTAKVIMEDISLQRLAWHCHYILFCQNGQNKGNANNWPSLENCLGDLKDMFPVIILISGLDNLLSYHKQKEIPVEITLDTVGDLRLWMENYYEKNGRWGFEQLGWLMNHFSGRLYRIGRLQFMHSQFVGDIKVYKNKKDGKVVTLSDKGITYRLDGQVNGTNGIYDEAVWTADFTECEGKIEGHKITRNGYAKKDKETLSSNEWEQVLSKEDGILDVHIPASGKMSHELCGESFRQAIEFFNKYFKEYSFRSFACVSWLLDPQLSDLLGRNSNIVKFQQELYLFPILSDDSQTFERVFGKRPDNLRDFECKTPLQISIRDHVLKGGHMRGAGMFLLTDDFEWGRG